MMQSRFKIFSDPVHGFISVPKNLLLDLIETPEMQRLRRIRQLGLGHMVFPGAEHSRFGHALGAMALMQEVLKVLSEKGTPISQDEHTAALAAALLHDIGHGPYSHTLEHDLMPGIPHEHVSRALIKRLNVRFGGALDTTLAMFDHSWHRPFFHSLISGQLDVDRLDYLRRDSFYTGVVEGQVGVDRLVKTLRVDPIEGGEDSALVLEAKGIYALENFLISRRLMYWQVYLHKTVLAGDSVLRACLKRVRDQVALGETSSVRDIAPSLRFFLTRTLTEADLEHPDVQEAFITLDDTDLLYSLKCWTKDSDVLLADLARRFLERRFPVLTFLDAEPELAYLDEMRERTAAYLLQERLTIPSRAWEDAVYYFQYSTVQNRAYNPAHSLPIRDREGRITPYAETEEGHAMLSGGVVRKRFLHTPRGMALPG